MWSARYHVTEGDQPLHPIYGLRPSEQLANVDGTCRARHAEAARGLLRECDAVQTVAQLLMKLPNWRLTTANHGRKLAASTRFLIS